jgi:uncharacterized membrane protein YfcA
MYEQLPLLLILFVIAALYSSVGHGGASGYLAVMALFGLPPEVMKPAALTMNIAVAGYVSYHFWRTKRLNWFVILPFIVLSIPMAYIGGGMQIHSAWYKFLIALSLLIAALWLLFKPEVEYELKQPPPVLSASTGAGLGFVSGLTGVGGGIFLSPILLVFRWADARSSAGVAAIFILFNSIAGLFGYMQSGNEWSVPIPIYILLITIIAGAIIGERINRVGENPIIIKLLSVVLVIASAKMFYYMFV